MEKKKNWFVKHKILTAILVIVVILIFKGAAESGNASRVSENKIKTEVKTVFDVPLLVGKNVDEIIAIIGQPKENSLPTEEQSKLTNEWSIEFGKDGQTLLVEYNLKTKVVKDLFISGDNKENLLKIGNLKENADNYTLDFVKQQTDPTKITGVTITKK
jgi:hypothetical protein